MEKIVTPRKLTTAQNLLFTGEAGEIVIDLDKNTLVIHDGVHAGGFPLARENLSTTLSPMLEARGIAKADLSNVSQDALASRGVAKTDMSNVSANSMAERGAMKADCSNGTGEASAAKLGLVRFASIDETLSDELPDGADAKAISLSGAHALMEERKGLPHGYITGFAMEYVSEAQLSFGKGAAKSSDDTVDLVSREPIVKSADATWEPGSGFGAMLPGTARAASMQYHAFAVRCGTNGTSDILFDASPTGANIAASEQVREWCGGAVRMRLVGRFSTDADGNISAKSLSSHGMDYSNAAHLAMPSERFLSLSLLFNNGMFTAPANGYYAIHFNKNTSGITYYYAHASYGGNWYWNNNVTYCGMLIPLSRNQTVKIETNVSSTSGLSAVNIRFIYANGEI